MIIRPPLNRFFDLQRPRASVACLYNPRTLVHRPAHCGIGAPQGVQQDVASCVARTGSSAECWRIRDHQGGRTSRFGGPRNRWPAPRLLQRVPSSRGRGCNSGLRAGLHLAVSVSRMEVWPGWFSKGHAGIRRCEEFRARDNGLLPVRAETWECLYL